MRLDTPLKELSEAHRDSGSTESLINWCKRLADEGAILGPICAEYVEYVERASYATRLYRMCGRFAARRYIERQGVPLRLYADELLRVAGLQRWAP